MLSRTPSKRPVPWPPAWFFEFPESAGPGLPAGIYFQCSVLSGHSRTAANYSNRNSSVIPQHLRVPWLRNFRKCPRRWSLPGFWKIDGRPSQPPDPICQGCLAPQAGLPSKQIPYQFRQIPKLFSPSGRQQYLNNDVKTAAIAHQSMSLRMCCCRQLYCEAPTLCSNATTS